jgi:hypothetical protein
MKKIIALLLVFVMTLSFASCKDKPVDEETTTGEDGTTAVADETINNEDTTGTISATESGACDILSAVWNSYADNEKFAAIGGSLNNPVDDAPGVVALDDETLSFTLLFPADSINLIDDAACLLHMMNVNTFTAGAYHTLAGTDISDLVANIKETVMNNQWMCGFPETFVVYQIDDYIISAFGAADLISNFTAKLMASYPAATALVEEAIV